MINTDVANAALADAGAKSESRSRKGEGGELESGERSLWLVPTTACGQEDRTDNFANAC